MWTVLPIQAASGAHLWPPTKIRRLTQIDDWHDKIPTIYIYAVWGTSQLIGNKFGPWIIGLFVRHILSKVQVNLDPEERRTLFFIEHSNDINDVRPRELLSSITSIHSEYPP